MPCCIALMRFVQCGHTTMFKIGCTTKKCKDLCDESLQHVLLMVEYVWQCEDCILYSWGLEDLSRSLTWETRTALLKERAPDEYDPEYLPTLLGTLGAREKAEGRRVEKQRIKKLEEVQWAMEWTFEYALMVFDVMYQKVWKPDEAAGRIKGLLALRLWDLVVTRDALRDHAELLRNQAPNSGFIITEVETTRQPEPTRRARDLPPVPVFVPDDEEGDDDEDEDEDVEMDLDLDGDVELEDLLMAVAEMLPCDLD